MKITFFCVIMIVTLTSCMKTRAIEETVKLDIHSICEEEYCHKFAPDTYRPVELDVGSCENDLEIKNQELLKLLEYHLISEEEYQEKLRLPLQQRDAD